MSKATIFSRLFYFYKFLSSSDSITTIKSDKVVSLFLKSDKVFCILSKAFLYSVFLAKASTKLSSNNSLLKSYYIIFSYYIIIKNL